MEVLHPRFASATRQRAAPKSISIHPPFISESRKEEPGTQICSYVVAFNSLAKRIISRACLDASPRHRCIIAPSLPHNQLRRAFQGVNAEDTNGTPQNSCLLPPPSVALSVLGSGWLWPLCPADAGKTSRKTSSQAAVPPGRARGDPVGSCSGAGGSSSSPPHSLLLFCNRLQRMRCRSGQSRCGLEG